MRVRVIGYATTTLGTRDTTTTTIARGTRFDRRQSSTGTVDGHMSTIESACLAWPTTKLGMWVRPLTVTRLASWLVDVYEMRLVLLGRARDTDTRRGAISR